jgi:post-segregation antitoxin (ccd killing protein)
MRGQDLYGARARKRTVSLTLNGDLYARAPAAGMNASRIAEAALAEALKAHAGETLREEIRRDMRALAAYVEQHGDAVAELREMFDPPDAARATDTLSNRHSRNDVAEHGGPATR